MVNRHWSEFGSHILQWFTDEDLLSYSVRLYRISNFTSSIDNSVPNRELFRLERKKKKRFFPLLIPCKTICSSCFKDIFPAYFDSTFQVSRLYHFGRVSGSIWWHQRFNPSLAITWQARFWKLTIILIGWISIDSTGRKSLTNGRKKSFIKHSKTK